MSSFERSKMRDHADISAKDIPAEDKAAFVKAMFKGIKPGTDAAEAVAHKRAGGTSGQDAELVRRIPPRAEAQENPELDAASSAALALAADIERSLDADRLDSISPQAQQALISALCRLYAANEMADIRYDALGPRSSVSATHAMVLCGALLRSVDLQVFELALWQSWSRR